MSLHGWTQICSPPVTWWVENFRSALRRKWSDCVPRSHLTGLFRSIPAQKTRVWPVSCLGSDTSCESLRVSIQAMKSVVILTNAVFATLKIRTQSCVKQVPSLKQHLLISTGYFLVRWVDGIPVRLASFSPVHWANTLKPSDFWHRDPPEVKTPPPQLPIYDWWRTKSPAEPIELEEPPHQPSAKSQSCRRDESDPFPQHHAMLWFYFLIDLVLHNIKNKDEENSHFAEWEFIHA